MSLHDWRLTDPLDDGDAPPVRRPCCGDLLNPWERCRCEGEADDGDIGAPLIDPYREERREQAAREDDKLGERESTD